MGCPCENSSNARPASPCNCGGGCRQTPCVPTRPPGYCPPDVPINVAPVTDCQPNTDRLLRIVEVMVHCGSAVGSGSGSGTGTALPPGWPPTTVQWVRINDGGCPTPSAPQIQSSVNPLSTRVTGAVDVEMQFWLAADKGVTDWSISKNGGFAYLPLERGVNLFLRTDEGVGKDAWAFYLRADHEDGSATYSVIVDPVTTAWRITKLASWAKHPAGCAFNRWKLDLPDGAEIVSTDITTTGDLELIQVRPGVYEIRGTHGTVTGSVTVRINGALFTYTIPVNTLKAKGDGKVDTGPTCSAPHTVSIIKYTLSSGVVLVAVPNPSGLLAPPVWKKNGVVQPGGQLSRQFSDPTGVTVSIETVCGVATASAPAASGSGTSSGSSTNSGNGTGTTSGSSTASATGTPSTSSSGTASSTGTGTSTGSGSSSGTSSSSGSGSIAAPVLLCGFGDIRLVFGQYKVFSLPYDMFSGQNITYRLEYQSGGIALNTEVNLTPYTEDIAGNPLLKPELYLNTLITTNKVIPLRLIASNSAGEAHYDFNIVAISRFSAAIESSLRVLSTPLFSRLFNVTIQSKEESTFTLERQGTCGSMPAIGPITLNNDGSGDYDWQWGIASLARGIYKLTVQQGLESVALTIPIPTTGYFYAIADDLSSGSGTGSSSGTTSGSGSSSGSGTSSSTTNYGWYIDVENHINFDGDGRDVQFLVKAPAGTNPIAQIKYVGDTNWQNEFEMYEMSPILIDGYQYAFGLGTIPGSFPVQFRVWDEANPSVKMTVTVPLDPFERTVLYPPSSSGSGTGSGMASGTTLWMEDGNDIYA